MTTIGLVDVYLRGTAIGRSVELYAPAQDRESSAQLFLPLDRPAPVRSQLEIVDPKDPTHKISRFHVAHTIEVPTPATSERRGCWGYLRTPNEQSEDNRDKTTATPASSADESPGHETDHESSPDRSSSSEFHRQAGAIQSQEIPRSSAPESPPAFANAAESPSNPSDPLNQTIQANTSVLDSSSDSDSRSTKEAGNSPRSSRRGKRNKRKKR